MHSVFSTLIFAIVIVLIIPRTASEQLDNKSTSMLVSRFHSLDPSTPYAKANPRDPSSTSLNDLRRRKIRRRGSSCKPRSEIENPLRTPSDLKIPAENGQNLPIVRTPFTDTDEKYCPLFQYAVCDSGVDSERILRVDVAKWTLKNCNRCERMISLMFSFSFRNDMLYFKFPFPIFQSHSLVLMPLLIPPPSIISDILLPPLQISSPFPKH